MVRVLPHQRSEVHAAGESRRAPAQPTPDSVYLAARVIRRRIRLALLASRLEATLTRP